MPPPGLLGESAEVTADAPGGRGDMAEKQWTRERPTMPGWYWHRCEPGGTASIMLLSGGRWYSPLIDEVKPRHLDGEWCGPLEPPAPGQGGPR